MSNKIKWLLHKILIVILILSSMANFLSHTRVTAASGGLIIDTENIYPNMNAPYQDGYNPKVEDNKAMIVLPLYQDGVQVIQGEQITASVEYGATTDTPFVVKQYEKKISSIAVPLTEGQMKMVYLVNFDLDLKENRKNGTYPVNIRIHYKKLNIESATGPLYIEVEQVFTTYIVINDGVDPNGNTNQPQEPVTILLEHCQINPEIVGPGETFQVTAQIKNKSKTKPISNIKVSYENAEGTFLPTTNLGTLYLERIEAEQSVSVEFSMKAASTFTINQPKILLTIEYEDDKGTKYTDTESIYVAIQNQEEEPPGEIPANIFEIETKYTYEGMETPYEEGYVPVIKNDKATVILPLISLLDEKDKMKDLTASVEFGELHNKVFQMKTYERKFSLKSLDTKEGGKQSVYGIRFELDLQKERMNGVYPVTISVRGEAEGQMREQRFTIYVIIEDGLDPEDEEEEEEPSPLTPKIILKACDITPEECHTGDIITIHAILENTSSLLAVQNISLTFASQSGELLPLDNSNSLYIDHIPAGGTKEVTYQMKIALEITSESQIITIGINGQDENAGMVSGTESVYLAIKQPFDMKVNAPTLPVELTSGSTQAFVVPVFNTGRTKIRNVMCVLTMEGMLSSQSAFIGEIEPAGTAELTINAVVANKKITDETVAEEDKYGYVRGTITVTYEDMEGNSYSKELQVSSKIIPPEDETIDKKEVASQWWISIIAGLIIIQVISYGIIFYRKKLIL